MAVVVLFDLDMTLVDSSALAAMRRMQLWQQVKANFKLIRALRTVHADTDESRG